MEENNSTIQNPESYSFDLQSDASGNWDLMIDKNIPEGPRILMVEDEYGNTDEALIYILKQTQTPSSSENFGLIDRVTTMAPEISVITIWSLVILVAISAINMARLAKQADTEAMGFPRQTKYFGANVVVAIVLVLLAFSAALFFNYKLGYFKIVRDKPELIVNKFSGQLLDPVTFQGIKADLSSGDTTVKTSESGYFVFNQVRADEGVYLTHPALQRSVTFLPNKKQNGEMISWYFSPEMYNTLIQVLDLEARGKFDDIYKKLPEVVSQKTDTATFFANYKTHLTPNNVKDQTVFIKEVSVIDRWKNEKYEILFDKVYPITVFHNNKSEVYYLLYEAGEWRILK